MDLWCRLLGFLCTFEMDRRVPAHVTDKSPPSWLYPFDRRRRSGSPCRLPKLPGLFHQSLGQCAIESNGVKLGRIVLPPLPCPTSNGASCPSHLGGSWLLPILPARRRTQIYRMARENRLANAPQCQTLAVGSCSAEERSTSGKLIAARLPPLVSTPPPVCVHEGGDVESGRDGASIHIGEHDTDGDVSSRIQSADVEEAVEEGPVTLSGHSAATVVDQVGIMRAATAAAAACDDYPPALQWTIDWRKKRQDTVNPLPANVDEQEEDLMSTYGMMAERQWFSAGKVRHSPPPSPVRAAALPSVSASERAQTATSSTLRNSFFYGDKGGDGGDDDDDDEEVIDEEIDQISDDGLGVASDDEADGACSLYRLENNTDGREMNGYDLSTSSVKPTLLDEDPFGLSSEQMKKFLNLGSNNNDEVLNCSRGDGPPMSPTFRRPSERKLIRESPLPNSLAKSPTESDPEDYADEDYPQEELRMAVKSRSVTSFSGAPTDYSPTNETTRQRSLPARRHTTTTAKVEGKSSNTSSRRSGDSLGSIQRIGLMPSSTMARRSPPTASPGGKSTLSVVNSAAIGNHEPQDPRSRVQSALKRISSEDWEAKVEGIKRLEELAASNGEVVSSDCHMMALALLLEVKNLRSQVSRVAIQTIGKLYEHCGKYMEQDLDRAVPLLLNKSGDTNRFIRDDAHLALMRITDNVSPPKAIIAVTTEGLSHKNATVRAEAAKLLAAIVDRMGAAKTLSGAKDVTDRVLPAAALFLQDGSLEARAQAKRMFVLLMPDPIFEKALLKYVPPSVIRNIQRTLEQLKKNLPTSSQQQ